MRIFYTFLIIVFGFLTVYGQGLEGIIVETYYIADENDIQNEDGGMLAEGAVTYRVYADMLPGYVLQSVYADSKESVHQLKIGTTTTFFNNEDRGGEIPRYSIKNAADNTVMLDSWLSLGAACKDHLGVLKSEDNGEENVVNNDGLLMNMDSRIGIPLTEQDGFVMGAPVSVVVVGEIQSALSTYFGDSNDEPGPHDIIINDGAWGTSVGAVGADLEENKVLIGQFTTDGIFSFELNIQIRRESDMQVEQFVARDPNGEEFLEPTLTFESMAPSSIKDAVDNSSQILLSPNPSTDVSNFVKAQLPEGREKTYQIVNNNGQLIRSAKVENEGIIETSFLNPGLYHFIFNVDGTLYAGKFLKL